MKVFIQSNKFQELAAKVSKYSFIKNGFRDVEIINVEECDILNRNFGKEYLRNGKITKYESSDLQSFTLLRFIPTLLLKKGYCMIVDPDIFAVTNPIKSIQEAIKYKADLYCTKIDNKYRSEIMILNLNRYLWNFEKIIDDLFKLKIDYLDLINLNFFISLKIKELDKKFNEHDNIKKETLFLHTSNRQTQPWKEGLKVNFKTYFSKTYIVKNYIKYILKLNSDKRVTSHYFNKHANQEVHNFVVNIFNDALINNFISKKEIDYAIEKNFISKKFVNYFLTKK
jgi:hypothetical protein